MVRADLNEASADVAIEASIEKLRELRLPGSWHVGPPMRPADLCERLEAHGFSACDSSTEPGMAADLTSTLGGANGPQGLAIDAVTDARPLAAFRQVLASGFGEGEPEANWVTAMYARIGLDDASWIHFLGSVDHRPVATASLFLRGGVAGIYFVCTAPEDRRQGIGGAITLEAMAAARARGYDGAVLTASPMGQGVYEQLGFREYCRIAVPEYDPRS